MTKDKPGWESELWSFAYTGDGIHCPIYDHCQGRLRGSWCPDDNAERVSQLLDGKRFNFSDFNFIKQGECSRSVELMERLAHRYLRGNGIHRPPVPNELVMLLDTKHDVEIRIIPLKSYHGAIWRVEDRWIIQLKNEDTPAMKRFTLFHEAFHILAYCRGVPVFRQRGVETSSFNEGLADYFAICFLMPREWVKERWAEVSDLDKMAKIFDVPKAAMCIRLKRLGLI